jgi:hypothetical protein
MMNHRHKLIVLSIVLSSFVTSITAGPQASAQSALPGKACSIFGATAKYGGKTLTCLKVNKKLIWQTPNVKAVNSKRSTPTTSGTPTSTESTPTAAKFIPLIPIQLPIKQNGEITFANAAGKVDRIPNAAWQSIQDVIATNKSEEIPTTLVLGPNTDTTEDQILNYLKKAYALWSGFRQPLSYAGLVYNSKDEAWAENEWPKLANKLGLKIDPKNYISNLRAGCGFSNGVATECWGGMAASFPGSDSGFAFYGVQSPYWSQSSLQSGPISQVTHEYTHNVQFAQIIGSPLDGSGVQRPSAAHSTMPCWFSEGQANAIGIPIVSSNMTIYMQGRDNSIFRPINTNVPLKPTVTNLSAESLTTFLHKQDIATCYDPNKNPDWQLGYNIGYAATEALIAIGGPQATMALIAKGASGMKWADSFESVYGISWKSGAEVLGQVLAAEYAGRSMFN